jgi:hypothetical protein
MRRVKLTRMMAARSPSTRQWQPPEKSRGYPIIAHRQKAGENGRGEPEGGADKVGSLWNLRKLSAERFKLSFDEREGRCRPDRPGGVQY